MVHYYGRHHMKQFIRGKPIRFGFKMWAHCSERGNLHSFEFYTGRHDNQPSGGYFERWWQCCRKICKATGLAKDSGCKADPLTLNSYISISTNKILHPINWIDQDINIKHFSNILFANFLKFFTQFRFLIFLIA